MPALFLIGGVGAATGALGAVAAQKIDLYYQTLGLTPPAITIRRLENEKIKGEGEALEERAVFQLSNVKVIDIGLIKQQISQDFVEGAKLNSGTKKGYDFSKDPTYTIKLTLKNQNISFAELDFSGWENNPDFEVVITKEGEKQVVTEKERQKVLMSLQLLPKFLGDQLSNPKEIAVEEMIEGSSYAEGILGKNVGGALDWALDLWKGWRTGKVSRVTSDIAQGPSGKLETLEFLDELADVALVTGKARKLLGHYEKLLINSHELKLATKEQSKRTELDTLKWAPGIITAVVLGLGSVAFLAAAISLVVFFPPSLLITVLGVSALLASGAAVVGVLVSSYFAYKRGIINKEMSKIESEKHELQRELDHKFAGLDSTAAALQEFLLAHSILDLNNKNLSDSCVRIISRWLFHPERSSSCRELRLANNKITARGVKKLAEALSKAPHQVRSIELTKNPLDVSAILAMKEMLTTNLTVTSFIYDVNPPQFSQNIMGDLDKQLLINRYLQGKLTADDSKKINGFFGSEAQLKKEVFAKIDRAQSLPAIDSELHLEFKEAYLEKQLQLLMVNYSDHSDPKLLEACIDICSKIKSEALADNKTQKLILAAIQSALFKKDDRGQMQLRFINHSGLTALRKLGLKARINLLSRALQVARPNSQEDQENFLIASLVANLMDQEGVFDPKNSSKIVQAERNAIEKIITWGKAGSSLKFTEYLAELKELQFKLVEVEAKKLETLIQKSLQDGLEAQFQCLQSPFGKSDLEELKEYLKNSLELKTFQLQEELDPEVKEAVQIALIRNKLSVIVRKIASPKENKVNEPIAVLEQDLAKLLAEIPAEKVEGLLQLASKVEGNDSIIFGIVKRDTYPGNCEFLKQIPEPQRVGLLKFCLSKDKSQAVGIATMVAKLVDLEVDSKYIWQMFNWSKTEGFSLFAYEKWSFREYIKELQALKAFKPELTHQLNQIINEGIKADLVNQFACLKGENDSPLFPSSFGSLQRELDDNYDLLEFEFPQESKVQDEVKKYVEYICQRNLMRQAAAKDNLQSLMEHYAKIPNNSCLTALRSLSQEKLLSILATDLGSSSGILNATIDFKCKELCKLNPKHQIALLEQIFSIEKEEEKDAHNKALLISSLLKQDILFNPEKQNDPALEKIRALIFWAISPGGRWPSNRSGKPYYKFSEVEQQLCEIKKSIENGELKDNLNLVEMIGTVLKDYQFEDGLGMQIPKEENKAESLVQSKNN